MGNGNGKPVVLTDEVNLNHFRLLRVVGKGAFGKVRIVERRDTGLTFALKYIRKDEVVRSESVRNIIRERRMLEHLNHPFICNLRYSFQDVEYLYYVVDLMTGGDLRFHITRKTFTEPAVRFWMAEIACALRYIHGQGIVHRDVKPDNILMDASGHVHLADFNVASELHPNRQLTSRSGTLAYLAPEVYAGRGYNAEVDWWSLGVVFYECIYSKRPFDGHSGHGHGHRHDHHHHEIMAQAILKADPPYPVTSPAVSPQCQHAMRSLLEKDRSKRIGAAGFETFTNTPFFSEIDFAALERREIEPIFCPASDKTNFDATYDLEELLLEEAPLEARARKQKPRAELRGDATKDEIRADELHRMIETMFEPFDYTLLPSDRAPSISVATTADPSSSSSHSTSNRTPTDPVPVQAPVRPNSSRSSTNSPEGSPPLSGAIAPQELSKPATNEHITEQQQQSPPSRGPPTRGRGIDKSVSGSDVLPGVDGANSAMPSPNLDRPNVQSVWRGGVTTEISSSHNPTAGTSSGAMDERPKRPEKPSGVLGFLSRKKGRDGSPKGKEKEKGVIGKEGARVVVPQG